MLRESLRGLLEGSLDESSGAADGRFGGEGRFGEGSDIEVELVDAEAIELLEAVERTEADVVVITLPETGEDPGLVSHLLMEFPHLLIIAISPVEESGFVYRQVITKEELLPLSQANLLATIRSRRQEKLPILNQRSDRGTVR